MSSRPSYSTEARHASIQPAFRPRAPHPGPHSRALYTTHHPNATFEIRGPLPPGIVLATVALIPAPLFAKDPARDAPLCNGTLRRLTALDARLEGPLGAPPLSRGFECRRTSASSPNLPDSGVLLDRLLAELGQATDTKKSPSGCANSSGHKDKTFTT